MDEEINKIEELILDIRYQENELHRLEVREIEYNRQIKNATEGLKSTLEEIEYVKNYLDKLKKQLIK